MESMNEVMELSTQDLDTVAGGCHEYKEDYCYEKRERKHRDRDYDYDCHKPRKGCGDYDRDYDYGCGGYKNY